MKQSRVWNVFLVALLVILVTVSGAFADLKLIQQEINVSFKDTRITPPPKTDPPAIRSNTPTPIPYTKEQFASEDMRTAEVGSVVSFGSSRQHTEGGETPLQWLVTEVSASGGNKVLTLLSLYVIQADQYHEQYARTTWANCDLRKELNGHFMYAFTQEESEQIMPYMTGPGLLDNVWIPSCSEWAQIDSGVRKALLGYTERGAYYAVFYNTVDGCWLRGGNEKSSRSPYIPNGGSEPSETEVDRYCGVRPMIRVIVGK